MGFLAKKRYLITGLISNKSIAYGIAQAMRREGAELAFSFAAADLQQRVSKLTQEMGGGPLIRCDVSNDDDIQQLFDQLHGRWPQLDGIVHSIAFAPRESLSGDYLESISRESFRIAHDISAYSFAALAKYARGFLSPTSALLTLTYLGAERVLPNYNVMGLAKASLEANVRYMAMSLGARGIRVNAISAGPIRTLAAAGINGFRAMLNATAAQAPLKRNITAEEVGNAAAFLCSDLASGITGETLYVDAGFHISAGVQASLETEAPSV